MADLTPADQLLIASCAALSLSYGTAGGPRKMHIGIITDVLDRTRTDHSEAFGAVRAAARELVNNASVGADRASMGMSEARLKIALARFFEERCGQLWNRFEQGRARA